MSPFALRSALLAAAFCLPLAACRSSNPDAAADSVSAVDAGLAIADAPIDAGVPAVPKPAELHVKVTAISDERTVELTPGELTEEVPPGSRIEVELPRLPDVRVRLFDEADKMVPSDDSLVLSGDTARYVLAPSEPLVTGTRYTLLIDGQRGELPTDSNGAEFSEVRLQLKTSGEKPKPAPAAKPTRKRRR